MTAKTKRKGWIKKNKPQSNGGKPVNYKEFVDHIWNIVTGQGKDDSKV